MKETKLALAKAFRWALAATLIIVISVILWYFLSHRRPPSLPPLKVEDISQQKVDRQEEVQHFDFKGDRTVQARAERHYAGQDNTYYLEGNVEIREVAREGAKERIISGDKAVYDKEWTKIFLEGKTKFVLGDLAVESSSLSYEQNTETLSTDQDVAFSYRKLSGKAQRMAYNFKKESLHLEGNVEFEIRDESQSSAPLVIKADGVDYNRLRKSGSVNGNVSFSLGESHGQAESAEFKLTPDELYVRNIEMRGRVKARLLEEEEVPESAGDPLLAKSKAREIEAEEMSLKIFRQLHRISSLEASGRCSMKSLASTEDLVHIRSGVMKIAFNKKGALRSFSASDEARMVEIAKDGQVKRSLSGQEILIKEKGERLRVLAEQGREARVDSPDSEVSAQRIALSSGRENMEAAGDVKAILKHRPENEESIGFFSSDKPVFVTAQEMRYDEKQNRLDFKGNIRMWQEKEMLIAEEMTVAKQTGEITAEGHVRAVFPHQPKKQEAKEEKMEMGGAKMSFRPKADLLIFDQDGWLTSQNIRLQAQSVAVFLREKTAEVQRIEAKGKVSLVDEFREGQGEAALYDVENETMVLTGNPVVTDKKKGIIEGDKLTFHLGDDRILVENRERDRSATVIKREK